MSQAPGRGDRRLGGPGAQGPNDCVVVSSGPSPKEVLQIIRDALDLRRRLEGADGEDLGLAAVSLRSRLASIVVPALVGAPPSGSSMANWAMELQCFLRDSFLQVVDLQEVVKAKALAVLQPLAKKLGDGVGGVFKLGMDQVLLYSGRGSMPLDSGLIEAYAPARQALPALPVERSVQGNTVPERGRERQRERERVR